jgi:hypothetical protein
MEVYCNVKTAQENSPAGTDKNEFIALWRNPT